MDQVVKFWKGGEKVETRYLNSSFLLKASALDLLEGFKTGISSLGIWLDKLLQISMDAPNVNLKFYDEFIKDLSRKQLEPKILETGSCSLHKVNGAFKFAHKKCSWNIDSFLKSLYNLFKNFPSRRGVYSRITNSQEFPKKFCSIRWTENTKVMERAMYMIPLLNI